MVVRGNEHLGSCQGYPAHLAKREISFLYAVLSPAAVQYCSPSRSSRGHSVLLLSLGGAELTIFMVQTGETHYYVENRSSAEPCSTRGETEMIREIRKADRVIRDFEISGSFRLERHNLSPAPQLVGPVASFFRSASSQ